MAFALGIAPGIRPRHLPYILSHFILNDNIQQERLRQERDFRVYTWIASKYSDKKSIKSIDSATKPIASLNLGL